MGLEWQELAPFTSVKDYEERSREQKIRKINRKLEEIQKSKVPSPPASFIGKSCDVPSSPNFSK